MLILDTIEHDTLGAQHKNPRIHFAVNCVSKGCLPLYGEPFEGRTPEVQLNDITRRFTYEPARFRLEGGSLYVSKIFDGYGGGFDDDPASFFKRYADGDLETRLEQQRFRLKVDYLDDDRLLNGN